MNREIQITIIGCAIIFASMGFVLYEMNYDKRTIQPEKIPKEITIPHKFGPPPTLLESVPTINNNTVIEESTFDLKIPTNNTTVPFGTIKGTVNNPAEGHPVIIQFLRSLDGPPVHIAQVDLKDDDTFEYQFRVFSIDDGVITNFFSGDYIIKIFATVNK